MAKLDVKTKENPKLQQSTLSDGRISLYLEYYLGRKQWVDEETGKTKIKHDRRKESLNLYILTTPRTPKERQTNKETLELAKEIRAEREQELKKDRTGKRIFKAKGINFLDAFEAYIDAYTKKDVRNMQLALNRFKDFLADKYPIYATHIRPEQLNKDMMASFVEYLQSRSVGEGAKSIYQRFKKFIRYAIDHDMMIKNPCDGVVCIADDQILRKDVLSAEEVVQLAATTYEGQNDNIRRAFIFCLYTGMRFCDVKELRYKHIDYSNKMLKFEQSKTENRSAKSGVILPLYDGLLSLIGEVPPEGKNALIFPLPSHTMCMKALKRWVARAGIEKHITWHCARHSLAVIIHSNGANITTVANILGHSGLKHTEKYTRAVDSLKEAAINSLPQLNL